MTPHLQEMVERICGKQVPRHVHAFLTDVEDVYSGLGGSGYTNPDGVALAVATARVLNKLTLRLPATLRERLEDRLAKGKPVLVRMAGRRLPATYLASYMKDGQRQAVVELHDTKMREEVPYKNLRRAPPKLWRAQWQKARSA